MTTPPSATRSGSRAVERAVALLACFDDGAVELSVSSFAARTGLPVSSAHRIAQALVRGGLLERVPGGDCYRIGPGLISLAVPSLSRLGVDFCAPPLHALATGIGITTHFGVIRGGEALTVFSARSPDGFSDNQIPRARRPAGASVMGRAMLAFGAGPGVVGVPAAEVDRIRRRGYALDADADDPSVLAVAVPVFGGERPPWGAIGVQADRRTLTARTVREIVPAMQHAASLIGNEICSG